MDGSAFNSLGKAMAEAGQMLPWAFLMVFAAGLAFGSLGTWLFMR